MGAYYLLVTPIHHNESSSEKSTITTMDFVALLASHASLWFQQSHLIVVTHSTLVLV